MSPDDWITVTGAVSASLVILGVAIEQWGKYPAKKENAQFYKEVFLERDRLRQIFYEKNKENSESKKERDSRINAETNVICNSWFGELRGDDIDDGVSRRKSRTKSKEKLVRQSETVFKLTEDIQEFTACSTCPDCGQTAFHFINSSDQNSKIMRECISCKKVWLQLK